MTAATFVDIKLCGNIYHIKCPQDKTETLQAAVDYLEAKMQETRNANPGAGLERTAILTALNIVHQLLFTEQPMEGDQRLNQRLQDLLKKVDMALAKNSQLELQPTD